MVKDLGPLPRISAEAPRYPWPRTEADMIPARRATLAANAGRDFPCPQGHGQMQPRPLESQTYEQLFTGVHWECGKGDYQKCSSGSLVPSRELAVHHGEPHHTDEGSWEKYDGTAWVAITDEEVEAYWAARAAWHEESFKRMQQAAARKKPTVAYDGNTYTVRSRRTEIPDLAAMDRMAALVWLNQNTYAKVNHRKPNPLAGLGDVISVNVR